MACQLALLSHKEADPRIFQSINSTVSQLPRCYEGVRLEDYVLDRFSPRNAVCSRQNTSRLRRTTGIARTNIVL